MPWISTTFLHLPLLAWVSLGLAVALTILMVVMLRRLARKRTAMRVRALPSPQAAPGAEVAAEAPAPVGPAPARFGADGLATSFTRALRFLKSRVSLKDPNYGLPWYLMLGEAGAGKTAALAASGLRMPFGAPTEVPELGHPDLAWWLFERAVVLDPSGRFLFDPACGRDDERGWRRLLGLIERHRPKRPLDGVVLVLPAGDLIGPARLAPEELLAKADRLNRKLWELQRALGMNLPVYVVVTKCDLVPGFVSLWRQVPVTRRGEILGWTSPHAAGSAFSAGWVSEAFAGLAGGILRLQLEVAADPRVEPVDAADLDGLAWFPDAFGTLEEPLRQSLDRMFRASGYHEAFFLRGIYFCGSELATGAVAARPGEAQAVPMPRPWRAASPRPILVRDLLEQVVFRENGLAQPAARALLARNRAVRGVQIGLAASILLGAIGLVSAQIRIGEEVGTLAPLFLEVAQAIAAQRELELALGRARAEGGTEVSVFREEDALRLLDVIGRIRTDALHSAFMPSSLVSDIDQRVQLFLTQGFETVVLRAMYHQLDQRSRRLFQRGPAEGESAADVVLVATETPEFQALGRLVGDLRDLEHLVQLYNRLGDGGQLADVGTLSEALFGVRLPSTFFERGELYRQALAQARYERYDLASLRGRAVSQVRELSWRLHDRLFDSGSLGSVLGELTIELRELAQSGGRDLAADAARLDRIARSLQAVAALLARPEVAWIARERLDLGDGFRRLLADIANSPLLSAELAEEIAAIGDAEFSRFQSKLLAYRVPGFGRLLAEQAGRPLPQFNPELSALQGALAGLFARDFMGVVARVPMPERYDPARPGRWDTAGLDRALDLFADFDRFAAERLGAFPVAYQDLVRRLAIERLTLAMTTTVARAWVPGRLDQPARFGAPEERLAELVADFREAAPVLERVLTVLRQIGRLDAQGALEAVASQQAADLLGRVDRLLVAESPYLPMARLDYWDGATPVALYAYDASDRSELRLHLELERERLQFLFQELAEPPVAFLARRDLARDPATRALAVRWQRLFDELGKYHGRRPDSSILALERFVQFDIADLTIDNCFERLSPAAFANGAGDFFLQRRVTLAETMLARCHELGGAEVSRRYNALAARFDAALAGRFPFAPAQGQPAGTLVDPATARAFFEQEGGAIDALVEQLQDLHAGEPGWDAAVDFLLRLQAARDFLFPGGPVPGMAAIAYLVAADFRVARAREQGGNQIIGWELALGDGVLTPGSEPRLVLWRHGMASELRLRWARNAPVRPFVADPGGPHRVEGDEVALVGHRDPWSLLRLIATHRAGGPVDGDGTVLAIEIPTAPLGTASGPGAGAGSTRVFVRLRLFAMGPEGERGAALAIPDFPTAAPRIAVELAWDAAPPARPPAAMMPPRRTWQAGSGNDGGAHGRFGRGIDDLGRRVR